MRAGCLVLSAGRRRRSSGAHSPSCRSPSCSLRIFSRNKSPVAGEEEPQVPVLLLRDMNLCYRLLRRLVPGLPPGRAASRVEILQHVIDYILDLQTELDTSCPATERPEPPLEGDMHRDRNQLSGQSPETDHTCQTVVRSLFTCVIRRFDL